MRNFLFALVFRDEGFLVKRLACVRSDITRIFRVKVSHASRHRVTRSAPCTCVEVVRANASVPFFMVTSAFQAYAYTILGGQRVPCFSSDRAWNVPNELTRSLENSACPPIEPH